MKDDACCFLWMFFTSQCVGAFSTGYALYLDIIARFEKENLARALSVGAPVCPFHVGILSQTAWQMEA
jgi:hypothetical protein